MKRDFTAQKRDRRRIAARPDLAADHLRGSVSAPRFVAGRLMRVHAEIADLRNAPSAAAALDTQALHGERVAVFEEAGGWAWCQLANDSYVGYLPCDALAECGAKPTHRVSAPRTFAYEAASIKAPVRSALPMGAEVCAIGTNGPFFELEGGRFVFAEHLAETERFEADFVSVAERFLWTPYLWGGKSWLGIDCSGLVQIALAQAGVSAPRDTDMMAAELGFELATDASYSTLRRGDFVFWKGHIGVMRNGQLLLHANGHHMVVSSEPLALVIDRISLAGGGQVASVRRIG